MNAAVMCQAVADAIAAQNVTVYLDVVPDAPTYPYVALFMDGGQRGDDSLGALMERSVFYPRMTCAASVPKKDGAVGSAALFAACAQSLRNTRDRAFGVIGQEITAGGAVVRVEHAGSSPAARDDDVPDRLVLYSVETLALRSLAL